MRMAVNFSYFTGRPLLRIQTRLLGSKILLTRFSPRWMGAPQESKRLVLCGIRIELGSHRSLSLRQSEFYPKIEPIVRSSLLQGRKVCVSAGKLQTCLRRFIGSTLWVTRASFDLGFGICQLASSLHTALFSGRIRDLYCDC